MPAVDTSVLRGVLIPGRNEKSVAGAVNVTLSADEARNERQVFTGALTGSISVIFPLVAENAGKTWTIVNQTTGAFKLSVTGHDGSGGLEIPQGSAVSVTWSGTQFMANERALTRRRHIVVDPSHTPAATENDGTVASGATGAVNVMTLDGVGFEYHIKGAGQTLLIPTIAAGGLLASLDLTNDEGVEYTHGITARSKAAFVVGTDAPFFFKVKFTLADVSGTDDCAIGFRTAEAYQANLDDYNNLAALNVIAGDIFIETIDDNAATTSTDTTNNWADGETHELGVYVSAAGVVTYKIDGAAPLVVAAHTIDNGDVVVPSFFFLHAATTPGAMHIVSWQCGFQADEV